MEDCMNSLYEEAAESSLHHALLSSLKGSLAIAIASGVTAAVLPLFLNHALSSSVATVTIVTAGLGFVAIFLPSRLVTGLPRANWGWRLAVGLATAAFLVAIVGGFTNVSDAVIVSGSGFALGWTFLGHLVACLYGTYNPRHSQAQSQPYHPENDW
jgi:hypothetical protein